MNKPVAIILYAHESGEGKTTLSNFLALGNFKLLNCDNLWRSLQLMGAPATDFRGVIESGNYPKEPFYHVINKFIEPTLSTGGNIVIEGHDFTQDEVREGTMKLLKEKGFDVYCWKIIKVQC